MAFGVRPYRAVIVARVQDAHGVWVATVEVRDSAATPSVRLAAQVQFSPVEDFLPRVQALILRAYAQDAGGAGQLVDALIATSAVIAEL